MAATRPETRKRAGRVTGPHPLYHRIYVHLKHALSEGALPPERALPSEPALAATYGVSRVTVRRTLDVLEAEGLVRRVRGVGTFPTPRPIGGARNISGLVENLITFERSTIAELLDWSVAPPSPAAERALGPAPALRVQRLRRYEGEPISLSTLHVPLDLAALIDRDTIGSDPVVVALERSGVVAERTEQALTAILADAWSAPLLGVAPASPLIAMRRAMLDGANRPILHQESLYAPERFEYRMTLTRVAFGTTARWTPVG
jgi:GntR family transcriptional regulator